MGTITAPRENTAHAETIHLDWLLMQMATRAPAPTPASSR